MDASSITDRLKETLRAMGGGAASLPLPAPAVPTQAPPPLARPNPSPSAHAQLQSIYGGQEAKRTHPGDPAEAQKLRISTRGVPGGLFAGMQGRDVTAERLALQRAKSLAQKLKHGGGMGRGGGSGNSAERGEAAAEVPREAWISEDQMGPEQRRGFRRVMQNESTLSGNNTFITGPGGSGKSFLIQALVQRWKRYGIRYRITATTGVAASNIGGVTFHSLLRLGKKLDTIRKIKFRAMGNRDLKDDVADLDVLVLDEISMWSPHKIRLLDEVFRALRPAKRHLPFGGVQMIFMGDFCQLGHVFTDEDRQWTEKTVEKLEQNNPEEALTESDDLIYEFCFQHPLWQKYIGKENTILLRKNFRQSNDPLLARICDKMRLGNIDEEVHRVLSECCIKTVKLGDGAAIARATGIKPTEIYAMNMQADQVNERELLRIQPDPRRHFVYKYLDIRVDETPRAQKVFDMYITSQVKDSLVKPEIRLAVGSRVMLLANLDVARGLANGTQGSVIGRSEPRETVHDPTPRRYPQVRFDNGEVEVIEPRGYECSYDGEEKGDACAMCFYVQVPLRLSDAFSVHKSQGQTLKSIFGDMRRMNHAGQAYTFISRVQTLDGLFICNYSRASIKTSPAVKEYYRELEEYCAQEDARESALSEATPSPLNATKCNAPDPVLVLF